jgi:stearoyl-CoA desaturase (delta-9 desaturase)
VSVITTATLPQAGPPSERLKRQRRRAKSSSRAWLGNVPFISFHLVCLAVLATGLTTFDLAVCALLYFVRMFGITAGYHRYFAHRSYKTSRVFQFFMACLGCSALQKGPLWWAGHHRHHHRHSDQEEDRHSPVLRTFWWSHVGWILSSRYIATDWQAIRDFTKFPELCWLNRFHWIPGILLGVACFLVGGWSTVIVGFFISTVILYHATFCINSLAHVFGKRRYATTDESRNSFALAILTLGEGWHNNHHYYQSSANQGFFWWEVDISYYMLKGLEKCGLVWDIRTPPTNKLVPKAVSETKPETPCPEGLG